ncbi:MAG TPA: sodium-dependent transporter [Sedimentisphaerales bacterium]|nr:sodium-dependent transporter [Sedimentisphaerales bacterium]
MIEMLEEQRESWGTRSGFVLAAIGSAIGLGNLWGFPYKLYSYGGAAFLIPYILALFVVGIPLMILEFSLGHYTQRAAPDAFRQCHKGFEIVGWWGIILGFVIVTYYPVILAYCFSFLGYSIAGIFNGGHLPWAGEGIEGVERARNFFFNSYLGYQEGTGLGALRWPIVWMLLISWASIYFCIFKGVKMVGRIVWLTVPLPWLMLVILAVRGLTLEGSMQGLVYYLDPVWSELAKPTTWRYAFGQVFFSLSLAFGVMVTYASFLHRKSDLNNNAAIIGLADFGTSFVAGIAVFSTLGGMAFATQQAGHAVPVEKVVAGGPSLAFVAFPYALAQLPYSAYFSFVFFFALVTLGIDSAFSIAESVVASIVDKTGWSRGKVLLGTSAAGLILGLFYVTKGGLNWLGTVDGFVNGMLGIALLGLLECVVLGWLWRVGSLRGHANSRSDWSVGKWWEYMIRMVVPVILGALFFWQLFDDIGNGRGFLRTPAGQWKADNCIGVGILAAAPIIAVVLSIIKGGRGSENSQDREKGLRISGRFAGGAALVIALSAAGLFGISTMFERLVLLEKITLWFLPAAGIAAMLISNYVLERYNTVSSRASWLARWAGIAGTLDVSGFMAVILLRISSKANVAEAAAPYIRKNLSGVSYVLLVVVFMTIVMGLSWCFYRALKAAESTARAEQIAEQQQAMEI